MNYTNAVCAILLFLLLPSPADADFQLFSRRSEFETAYLNAGGIASVFDFDLLSPGTIINDGDSINGLTFNYNMAGVALRVASGAATTSGLNYLGTDDGDIFQSGDSFSLGFSERIGIGVYIISADPLLDGDVQLSFGGETVSLVAADTEFDFGLDGSAWFLGILSDTPFTSATLLSPGPPSFFFNVDSIITVSAVPEPSTMILFPALACLGWRFHRRPAIASKRR